MKIEIISWTFRISAFCHPTSRHFTFTIVNPPWDTFLTASSLLKHRLISHFTTISTACDKEDAITHFFCNAKRLNPFTRLAAVWTQRSSRFFHFLTCHTSAIKILSRLFACYRFWKVNLRRRRWNNVTTINIYSNDTKLKVLWRQRFAYQMIWSLIN